MDIQRKNVEDTGVVQSKSSTILFVALAVSFLISAGFVYYRFYITQDFQLYAEVDCDPSVESCFIYECDPEWDDWCIEEPENELKNMRPYKIREKSARNTPKPEDANCDAVAGNCPPLVCEEGDETCFETFCDPAVDGEDACIGPGEYFFVVQRDEIRTEENIGTVEENNLPE